MVDDLHDHDDADECYECQGVGGRNSCMEDCCPALGGEDGCDDPLCWHRCSTCGGKGYLPPEAPDDAR